ncbi:hypothetical protein MIMGU_mgv1a022672mg [Erythranthe guttata]|uniref:Uncharacterized protein n=1 Tax=Erythranthe guttata TaxID=4155 RepID=A0A022RIB6_ERYGU|nr:hypothetical protein MIMGU_mgv1a022672mg [Erythranthe guttata]
MNDEYARSAVDWGEIYSKGFDEVAYPWGKPRYSCPVVYHRKDIVLIFPEIGGAGSNGVNILVALPANEMDKFESLFRKYLP